MASGRGKRERDCMQIQVDSPSVNRLAINQSEMSPDIARVHHSRRNPKLVGLNPNQFVMVLIDSRSLVPRN